ncbi:DUF6270 domain-containing protein [Bacillus gaemokensis]|uniref:DUF6270 domain-containing protein n=1 Tax=Bacillus gaemokensis TaxID=574375 RepID=UPI00068FB1DB|nr:DUF6270 domain-containing protein [Bacillus gaemokensis]KYG37103.1 hypothetical protein AZF08_06760 [Bacillus gaemokensis]
MYKLSSLNFDNKSVSIKVMSQGNIDKNNDFRLSCFIFNEKQLLIHEHIEKTVIREDLLESNIEFNAILYLNLLLQQGYVVNLFIKVDEKYYPIQMDILEFGQPKYKIPVTDTLYLEPKNNKTLSFMTYQIQKAIKLSGFEMNEDNLNLSIPKNKKELKGCGKCWIVFKRRNEDEYDEQLKCEVQIKENILNFKSTVKEVFHNFSLHNETIIDVVIGIEGNNVYEEFYLEAPNKNYSYTKVKSNSSVKAYINNKGYLSIYTRKNGEELNTKKEFVTNKDSKAVTVAILGSCVTRDNFNSKFNYDYKRYYECVLLQNQTSIISLLEKPITFPVNKVTELNQWDSNDMRADFEKNFLNKLEEEQPDYLIMDFFGDVFFGCMKLADTYVTNNYWKLGKTQFVKEVKNPQYLNIIRDTEDYLVLWKKAIHNLFKILKERVPNCKIVVHKARFVEFYYDENNRLQRIDPSIDVALVNKYWSILDNYVLEKFNVQCIDLNHKSYTAYEAHPWGLFGVHYDPKYYNDFLNHLHEIVLTNYLEKATPVYKSIFEVLKK